MKRSKFGPVVAVLFAVSLFASASFAQDESSVWTRLGKSSLRETNVSGVPRPASYEGFVLNKGALQSVLGRAPEEFSGNAPTILSLPMPDGSLQRFEIEHSLVVEPGLLAQFPELGATYRGYGIDDPTATVRFDLLPSGFHSIILSANGTFVVDPAEETDTNSYISYNKADAVPLNHFECDVQSAVAVRTRAFRSDRMRVFGSDLPSAESAAVPEVSSGSTLRTYRLALAATGEYTTAVGGGTVAGALAAQVLIMNRVNGIYERDLAIHMNIVANNNLIIYTNGSTDPYTNNNGSTMLGENTTNLNAVIGTANYDIGHVFSTGGGGVAVLNGPCGTNKARGVTGLTNPVGDAFAIDYVAHEMGHQWGADHTFNGTVSNCGGGNRVSASAYEPGSGITIMGYAGICGSQDLDRHSIDTFHVKSLEVITAYSQTGNGSTCAVSSPTGNSPPGPITVGGPYTIPIQTPFALTASATDDNGDPLTYDWQEYDAGGATGTTAVPNSDLDAVARPIFRPYPASASGTRYFPSLAYILNNANVPPSAYDCGRAAACLTGELLPTMNRTMTFKVVVRDNRASGGGINTATSLVNVSTLAGPFSVTSPNTAVTYSGNSQQTVTWNVANSNLVPVNAQNVDILLSTDGGLSFPTVLATATPNDGSQAVAIPNVTTSSARIKVQATGNIFFDISDTNFSITASGSTISGRVFGTGGRAVTNAVVILTFPNGSTQSVTTNRTGNYSFGSLPNATYTVSAHAGRYSYSPKTIPLTGSLSDQNFTPL